MKNPNRDLNFIYYFRCEQKVVLPNVGFFPLKLSLVNFVLRVVLSVLFFQLTSVCVDGGVLGLICNFDNE